MMEKFNKFILVRGDQSDPMDVTKNNDYIIISRVYYHREIAIFNDIPLEKVIGGGWWQHNFFEAYENGENRMFRLFGSSDQFGSCKNEALKRAVQKGLIFERVGKPFDAEISIWEFDVD